MNSLSVMVDIETLGITPNSKILSIGACHFDLNGKQSWNELEKDSFYANIDMSSYDIFDGLFSESASTLKFWKEQPEQAKEVLKSQQKRIVQAVDLFLEWLTPENTKIQDVWANSPSFDLAILKTHMRVFGIPDQWPFWVERDYRTLKSIYSARFGAENGISRGIKHHALHDSIQQALDTQRFYGSLMGSSAAKQNVHPIDPKTLKW